MHVLVIGSGGREHALVEALLASPQVSRLSVAPGNPGMEGLTTKSGSTVQRLEIDALDSEGLLIHARREAVDLAVVGPEAPLAMGLTDRFEAAGLAVFGPSKAAAQLEASKHFAKQIMEQAGVPTGGFAYCHTKQEALEALARFNAPYVIKEDGLAAGKGVTVTSDLETAKVAIASAFAKNMPVVIEAFLEGQELSVFAVCDGQRALPLVAAQDFKRALDNDEGPNTGGMGAYAPVPFVDAALMERVKREVLEPMLATMRQRGTPYQGLLYAGLMIAPDGTPNVVEFNCRFGDPETQVVLPLLLQSGVDVASLLLQSARGDLSAIQLPAMEGAAVTVVLASEGYPGAYATGKVITLPDSLPEGSRLYHAGTKRWPDGQLVTSGGRVFAATGLGQTLAQARQNAYALADAIAFQGKTHRGDIALKASQTALAV